MNYKVSIELEESVDVILFFPYALIENNMIAQLPN